MSVCLRFTELSDVPCQACYLSYASNTGRFMMMIAVLTLASSLTSVCEDLKPCLNLQFFGLI